MREALDFREKKRKKRTVLKWRKYARLKTVKMFPFCIKKTGVVSRNTKANFPFPYIDLYVNRRKIVNSHQLQVIFSSINWEYKIQIRAAVNNLGIATYLLQSCLQWRKLNSNQEHFLKALQSPLAHPLWDKVTYFIFIWSLIATTDAKRLSYLHWSVLVIITTISSVQIMVK